MQKFDVVVIGGGPAGAASALKCSQSGFNTVLVEKGPPGRHKPCGGVLPNVCVDILDALGLNFHTELLCSPPTIGLFYVPPSGRINGGSLRNYRLLNVNRDRFDESLRKAAEISGATILHEAEFVKFERNRGIRTLIQASRGTMEFSSTYLIGADGAYSRVRRQLYPNVSLDYLCVVQEHWLAKGDLGEYFYAFFRSDVTPIYSYVIPKNGSLLVGTAVPHKYHTSLSDSISRFKEWLRREFAFDPIRLERREVAAVPYGLPPCGHGNVILAGDAAGFCNNVSGEGIRLAIESGISASEAVLQAESDCESLSSPYARRVQSLRDFIQSTREFSIGMTDDEREEFVKSELRRGSPELSRTLDG